MNDYRIITGKRGLPVTSTVITTHILMLEAMPPAAWKGELHALLPSLMKYVKTKIT